MIIYIITCMFLKNVEDVNNPKNIQFTVGVKKPENIHI